MINKGRRAKPKGTLKDVHPETKEKWFCLSLASDIGKRRVNLNNLTDRIARNMRKIRISIALCAAL